MTTADHGYFPLLPASYLQNSSDAAPARSASVAGTGAEGAAAGKVAGNKYAASRRPQYDHWLEAVERQRIRQRTKRRQLALHARAILPMGCNDYTIEQLEGETAQAELRLHNPDVSSSEEEDVEEEEEGVEEVEDEEHGMVQYEVADEEAVQEEAVQQQEDDEEEAMDEEELLALAAEMDEARASGGAIDAEMLFNSTRSDAITTAAAADGQTPWLRRASHGAQRVVSMAARYAVSAITRRDAEAAQPTEPASDEEEEEEEDGSSMELDDD
ncbi:hypothetical protein SYNPS1DRAFT_26556 [Syncephalis pseudoplumigaleata]|uniref:Uncharacterized protein n=1 Tax=Syncephalis pseudoplumigaleata TaxID=1712513 RepID=A0A4P9Z5A5_9FUNG|nr:hypothetical protein SYNPS1DRAFT_26556 [Syncephalis pseudoplumigaleata]|eukprot:RKP27804.1 hypothetical protein SYNPS1DRAFT_26556 [Syncephalis pseudoplumigaleata]